MSKYNFSGLLFIKKPLWNLQFTLWHVLEKKLMVLFSCIMCSLLFFKPEPRLYLSSIQTKFLCFLFQFAYRHPNRLFLATHYPWCLETHPSRKRESLNSIWCHCWMQFHTSQTPQRPDWAQSPKLERILRLWLLQNLARHCWSLSPTRRQIFVWWLDSLFRLWFRRHRWFPCCCKLWCQFWRLPRSYFLVSKHPVTRNKWMNWS